MSHKNLGRLQKVELREIWLSEAAEFTPWLAKAENLKLLGETVGVDLECEAQEKEVGPFRADILCKDTATDSWVLIENQLERTDHCHLGQLLTYAAGLEVVTVVWVAERFTEEHRAALDWLNERTDEKINFFGLEVELWRIGDSPVAPKFNVVCKPNDWTRSIQLAAQGEVSEHRQLQLRFWTGFKDYMEEKKSFVKCQKPGLQNWMNHPLGRSGLHLASVISAWNFETGTKGPEIRVEVYLDGKTAKQDFSELEKQKAEIERSLGFPLRWYNAEGVKACRLAVRKDADFLNEALWPQQFEWLRQHVETMHRVFAPIVKNLRRPEYDGEIS
jgi:hypothetical protein